MSAIAPVPVALAGFGTVGRTLAARIAAGAIPGLRLTAVSALDLEKARRHAQTLAAPAKVVPVAELPAHAEIIVECAVGDALPEIARVVLGAGKTLVPISVGAIARYPEILEWAKASSGRIRVPSGTLVGLDALRAAAEGEIGEVRLFSRIRPDSLAHEAYVLQQGHDFSQPPPNPVKVFEGNAGGAAKAFPRHFNVAVTLALAGIGFERTQVEIWADPDIPGAVHRIEVVSDGIVFTTISRNRPSATNPRTSRIVAQSVLATLRSLVAPVQLGS
jgi:aspartate dehydrogenase